MIPTAQHQEGHQVIHNGLKYISGKGTNYNFKFIFDKKSEYDKK